MAKNEELNFDKPVPSAEKLKALQNAMAKIDKDFGKGAIMRLGDEKIDDVADTLPLMKALAAGGIMSAEITFRTASTCYINAIRCSWSIMINSCSVQIYFPKRT